MLMIIYNKAFQLKYLNGAINFKLDLIDQMKFFIKNVKSKKSTNQNLKPQSVIKKKIEKLTNNQKFG